MNYASSNETLEELYGYEPWRLAKLRALKQKYDPHGKFDFYAPISLLQVKNIESIMS